MTDVAAVPNPLLEQPPEDALALVSLVAETVIAEKAWPIWQYVDLTLGQRDMDPQAALQGITVWGNHYAAARRIRGEGDDLGDKLRLTMLGLQIADCEGSTDHANGILKVIAAAAKRQAAVRPSPVDVQRVVLTGADLLTEVGIEPNDSNLALVRDVIQLEPGVGAGLSFTVGSDWQWDLSRFNLRRFAVTTLEDYFAAMGELVVPAGLQAFKLQEGSVVSAEQLTRAFDDLNETWKVAARLSGGKPILRVTQATLIEKITRDVSTTAGFQIAVTALAELIARWQVRRTEGVDVSQTLNTLVALLTVEYPGRADRAVAAVEQLRLIVSIRNTETHDRADILTQQRQALHGLGIPVNATAWDWWNGVKSAAVAALRVLREEVAGFADADDANADSSAG